MAKTAKPKPKTKPTAAAPVAKPVVDHYAGLNAYKITAGPHTVTEHAADERTAWAQFLRTRQWLQKHPRKYATPDNPSGRTITKIQNKVD